MILVLDSHIPYLAEAVQRSWPSVEVFPLKPEEIDASAVRDADVLVVRTRTQVDESLLQGSKVRLVCTATIGYDHIDTAYCEAHGIRWMSCPGCNAQAVCDYIEEALDEYLTASFASSHTARRFCSRSVIQQSNLCIGIVGIGHVGSLVAKMAERKGFRVLLNDPPEGIGFSFDESGENGFFRGGEIADCDIITFHTPLTQSGEFPTYHLCDDAFLKKCKPGALIINAARGGVVDEQALLRSGHPYILDTWENEPNLSRDVLSGAFRASMHIAGYSEQGKRNATQMCLDRIADTFGLPQIKLPESHATKGDTAPGWLARVSETLKSHPDQFETLRRNYPLR